MNRLPMAVAAGGLLLSAAALIARAHRVVPEEVPPGPAAAAGPVEQPLPDHPEEQPLPVALGIRIAGLVEQLKAQGSGDLASMIQEFPILDVLREIGRHGPLEEGFLTLHRMVAGSPSLRMAVLRVAADETVDQDTRLFALRLLPPFATLSGDLEKAPILRQADRPLEGEFGRQLVRYVAKPPAGPDVAPWLSRLAGQSQDPSVRIEAFRAMARCPGPVAEQTLKQWIEDPSLPASLGAALLGALAAPERLPWLPAALEQWVRVRPGDPFGGEAQQRAFHAVDILGRCGETRRLAVLLVDADAVSEPEKRAFIAFGLRWLPGPEAEAALASMASDREESPDVRRIAAESLTSRR